MASRSSRTSPSGAPHPLGRVVRDLRQAIGWTQADLAREAGFSQAWISTIERDGSAGLLVGTAERLVSVMGGRLLWTVDTPVLADRRLQRDAGHVRCVSYVMARLRGSGWRVATEVEVGGDRSRGWIDILAHHPLSGVLLVVEVKTELQDLGAIQRTLGWYEREAWTAARRLGWRPWVVVGALLLLETMAADERVGRNRGALDAGFPGRVADLCAIIAGRVPERRGRCVAMIEPMSRRVEWLRPLRIDGRRSLAPHADYADFIRARHARSRAHRRSPPR